jgi:anti-anti-sigma regulatory factor
MSKPQRSTGTALQREYADDIAIINASGDLRGEPPDKFEKTMMKILEDGYRLVILDFFHASQIDSEAIGDFASALKEAFRLEAEVVCVHSRRFLERDLHQIITMPWTFIEFYYGCEEALEALHS